MTFYPAPVSRTVMEMRIVAWIFVGLIAVVLVAVAGILAFDAPAKPTPLASISEPFDHVDFSDLPSVRTYAARDGAMLGYRAYEGGGTQVVVLIHGSSDDGAGIHPLAKALRDAGASVYVPVVRGHRGSGRSGDIDYIGQLEDDLADFVAVLKPLHPDASFTLIGFSSGGGFVLRAIGGPDEKLFDRFIMISPLLPYGATTGRPGIGGWISLALPRTIAVAILNGFGIRWFNGLPTIAFATSATAPNLTSVYSFRLMTDFGPPDDYLTRLGRSRKPTALLVGGADEVFYPDRFAPLLQPVRPDLRIVVVPGVGHIGMTVTPEGIAPVRDMFLALH
jgi:pimeloyl-ACP methyl ester carboxylesterase